MDGNHRIFDYELEGGCVLDKCRALHTSISEVPSSNSDMMISFIFYINNQPEPEQVLMFV